MNCTDKSIKEKLTGYLDNELTAGEAKAVESHLATCHDCANELGELKKLGKKMRRMPWAAPPPDASSRFDAMLAREANSQNNKRSFTIYYSWRSVAAAVLLFATGALTGFLLTDGGGDEGQTVVKLENDLAEMRQMLMYAMISREAPAERLKGVYYAQELAQPNEQVTEVLFETLNSDPNVNVRLAAANALAGFTSSNHVVSRLVHSLEEQQDPLLQIVLIKALVEAGARNAVPVLQKLTTKEGVHEMVKEEAQTSLTILL